MNFPIRLVSSKAIREIINFEYDGNNLQQLARKYGYSDRQIRRLLKEKEDEDILDVEESELPYITNIKRQIIEDGKKKKEGDIER